MASTLNGGGTESIVLVGDYAGRVVIPLPSRLKRLNYFDGKFLRADDLRLEQDHLRLLTELANQAGGSGVVQGFDTTLAGGDGLRIGPGHAIDGAGRALLLTDSITLGLRDLIEASRRRPAETIGSRGRGSASFGDCELETVGGEGPTIARAGEVYVISIGHAEARCGEEDVYGRLCEEACVTSADRPYLLDGIVLRALPLTLSVPAPPGGAVALDQRHLRSRLASAYFAQEALAGGSLISRAGLASEAWCLGSHPDLGGDVPVAVVAFTGSSVLFLDPWIARRERMEAPARGYWAGRMAMRPWAVFLAHVLQFQCQLHELLEDGSGPGGPADPCAPAREAAAEAHRFLARIESDIVRAAPVERAVSGRELLTTGLAPEAGAALRERSSELRSLRDRLRLVSAGPGTTGRRILVDGGIVELPSAGYLPVVPLSTETVNEQVRRWVGEGVDLRFCVVRPDYVPHALEEAQHMDRISLLAGLADPATKPRVDVLVPNGRIVPNRALVTGRGWDARITAQLPGFTRAGSGVGAHGPGRSERLETGGAAFHFAGSTDKAFLMTRAAVLSRTAADVFVSGGAFERVTDAAASAGISTIDAWLTGSCLRNVFALAPGEEAEVRAGGAAAVPFGDSTFGVSMRVVGDLTVVDTQTLTAGGRRVRGRFSGFGVAERVPDDSPEDEDETTRFDLDVELTLRTPAGGTPSLEVVLAQRSRSLAERRSSSRIIVQSEWEGQPLEVTIVGEVEVTAAFTRLVALEEPTRLPTAAASLRHDDDVLRDGHPLRSRALRTLDTIGAALEDDAFAAKAARALFPPPPPASEDLHVGATLDWVLFHRRRDKDCGRVEEPLPPPPATTCHEVYRLTDDPKLLPIARKLIEEGRLEDLLRQPGAVTTHVPSVFARPLGDVDFAGGTASVLDDGDVAARWAALGGGEPRVAHVFSRRTDADAGTEPVRRRRAEAIATLVAPGGDEDVEIDVHELGDDVPGDCAAITVLDAAVSTICHEVYLARNDSDGDALQNLVENRDILRFISSGVPRDGGEATFPSGSATPTELEVANADEVYGFDTQAVQVFTFVRSTPPADQPYAEQATAIADAVSGGSASSDLEFQGPLEAANDDRWPTCEIITVVVVIG